MHNDNDFKRLKLIIVLTWVLGLLTLIGITFYFSYQIKTLKDSITVVHSEKPIVIHGIDGKNGVNGLPGLSIVGAQGPIGIAGTNGMNGQSVTSAEIAAAVTTYLQTNPVIGQTGKAGKPGTTGQSIEVQVDPVSCQLESKYPSDDSWTFLAQLPSPCTTNTDQ